MNQSTARIDRDSAIHDADEVPFAVYMHWPFCAQKCPYCDFNSHVRHGGWDEVRFLGAYLAELAYLRARIGPRNVGSIFFGGGTPSLMRPETVATLIGAVARQFTLLPDAEITLEANPSSVEAARFRGYRDAGVNRVSLGVQSLRDEQLRRLGRLHNVAEALRAIEIANTTFDRVSFDLIYARPGQTPFQWRDELNEALKLATGHLSLYQLTIEPGTPFERLHADGKLVLPEQDDAVKMYWLTETMTRKAGLEAYEVSNYAAPGQESRHNLVYWRYGEYLGIGPGAHGRIVHSGARHATVAEKNPEAWASAVESGGHGMTDMQRLTRAEEADELLLMGLRLTAGLDTAAIERRTGLRLDPTAVAELADLDLLEPIAGSVIRTRPRGRMVLNAVVAHLARHWQPAQPA